MATIPSIHDLPEIKVYLNIYDISRLNNVLHPLGVGAYHTGVHFYDVEFAFGYHPGSQTGVYEAEPKQSTEGRFKYSIYLGTSKLSIDEVLTAIEELKIEYAGFTYDIFNKNCNHFSDELCRRLVGVGIPSYLNRLARISKMIRCLIPKKMLQNNAIDPKGKHRKTDSLYLASKKFSRRGRNKEIMNGTPKSNEMVSLKQNDECLSSIDG